MEQERKDSAASRRDIALFVVLAFVFRLVFWIASRRVVDSADAIHYIRMAEQFADGQFAGFYSRIPVLYPALSALCHLVVPDMEAACRIVSLVASSFLVWPFYRLAEACFGSEARIGRPSARCGALVVALWPWLADYASNIAPEAVTSVLWFGAVWAFARSLREGGVWLGVAPLMFFALHLVRPEGTFLMMAAPVGGLILCIQGGEGKAKRLFPFIGVCAVLLAAYVLYMRYATGHAVINPRMDGGTASIRHLFVEQGVEMARTFIKVISEVIPIMLGPFLLILVGVGLFHPFTPKAGERPRDVRLELLILYFVLVQAAMAVLSTYATPRYIMPVTIAAAIWAGRGMAVVAQQAGGLPRWRWLRFAPATGIVSLLLFGAAAAIVPEYLGRLPQQPREFKIAGLWMKEQGLEPGLILTRKPWAGFYAEMETTGPEAGASTEEIVAYGKQIGARYLVVDERYSVQLVPGLKPLLDPANAPPGLRLLNANLSPYPEARIVIYEYTKE